MIKVLCVNVDDMGYGGVFSLVRTVIANKPDDIKIDIACIEEFENPKNIEYFATFGTSVYFIGSKKNKILKQLDVYNNLRRLIIKNGYDCIHIHSDVSNKLYVCALAAKRAGAKKIILHSHASGVDGSKRGLKLAVHKFFRKKLKRVGTNFVACSDLAARWMFPNISSDDVAIIKNGVELDKFVFDPQIRLEQRAELGLRQSVVFGHVGRFAYQKNHEFLIKVFAAANKKLPSAKLLLIGEGPLVEDIRSLARELGVEENVIFYGITSKAYKLFQAMDVFLLPSHFEGLPIAGVEAQAAGLPCIFSDKITREAALTPCVEYLPIEQGDEERWAEAAQNMLSLPRENRFSQLKSRGYDITDTINSLVELYR